MTRDTRDVDGNQVPPQQLWMQSGEAAVSGCLAALCIFSYFSTINSHLIVMAFTSYLRRWRSSSH